MQQLEGMAGHLADALGSSWRLKARPDQLPPEGDWWTVWLLLAGRGYGKTRTGAEFIHEQVQAGISRIALVAPTAADCRDVMIEGESGILATAPKWNRPEYQPSLRRVTWPNGAQATAFSADEPERLRGPQHEVAWCDELGTWRYPEAWDQLQFGLRLGSRPLAVVTTTPRPTKLLKDLISREGDDVTITRGKTRDNMHNLPEPFIKQIEARYGGTRLGRQELDGEFLDDVPGAMWSLSWFDRDRVDEAPPLNRIVVAIDPAVSSKEGSDETGIVVAGTAGHNVDAHGYVLEDATGRYAPHEWAAKAVDLYHKWEADCIVAEVNNGGEMVGATLRMVDAMVPFKDVRASRGKAIRAEPVAALYEQAKIHHVGQFRELEDQFASFSADFDRGRAGYSPDRLDAAVWAFTELMLDRRPAMRISAEAIAASATSNRILRPNSQLNSHDMRRLMSAGHRGPF